MGWIWASNKSQDKPSDNTHDRSPAPPARAPSPPQYAEPLSEAPLHASSFPPPPAEETQPTPPLTRDEIAEAEFRAFLRDLESEDSNASSSPAPLFGNHPSPIKNLFSARRQNTISSSENNNNNTYYNNIPSTTTEPPSDLKIRPENLHPTTLSCRAAFDAAFYCQSLGGQFNSVYHYGTIRDCSPLWSQFWFCVKTNRRHMSEEERKGRVLEHYRMRETKYRVGPSSEDVWVQRETMLVGAFEGDLEAVMRAEEQRRRGEEDGE